MAARWQLRGNLRPLSGEASVQHAVGLVEHQDFHRVDGQRVALQQVQQSSRRRYHQVRTAAQGQHLGVHRHPAKHRANPHVQSLRPGLRQARHLHHQLAGRHQHQSPDRTTAGWCCGAGCDPVQQGQQIGRRFAGAGVCNGQNVLPVQHRANRRLLNRRDADKAGCMRGCAERRGQTECGKGHGIKRFGPKKMASSGGHLGARRFYAFLA